MARGQNTGNQPLVQGASRALDTFKYEVAQQLGINQQAIQDGYWGELSSRACGAVGGHMVRRMIALAEQQLASQGGTLPGTSGFAGTGGGTVGGGGTTGGFGGGGTTGGNLGAGGGLGVQGGTTGAGGTTRTTR